MSGWSGNALWVGFRCARCGDVSGAHIIDVWPGDEVTNTPPTVWNR